MVVDWTPHRFSGGVLALDVANTVVLRGNPGRRFDRFDDPAEIARFAAAAGRARQAELAGRALAAPNPLAIAPVVLAVREATDALFRGAVVGRAMSPPLLANFLSACAAGLSNYREPLGPPGGFFGAAKTPLPFEAALSISALSLLASEVSERLRICDNCGWLFADRSRNASRRWCDMAVCGNRRKASRHYHRRLPAREVEHE